jgi:hypothetical protein
MHTSWWVTEEWIVIGCLPLILHAWGWTSSYTTGGGSECTLLHFRKWLAMPKIIRRERPYLEHLVLSSHSIHHKSTHMHFSVMAVWLVYSFGFNLWLCEIFETRMPYFCPYHELHISLLEVGERRRTKTLVRVQTLWAIRECHLRNLFLFEKSFKLLDVK